MPQTVVVVPLLTSALSQHQGWCVLLQVLLGTFPVAEVTALRFWWEVEIFTHSSGSSLFLIQDGCPQLLL